MVFGRSKGKTEIHFIIWREGDFIYKIWDKQRYSVYDIEIYNALTEELL